MAAADDSRLRTFNERRLRARAELDTYPRPPNDLATPTTIAVWWVGFQRVVTMHQDAFGEYMEAERKRQERFANRTTAAIVIATIVIAAATIAQVVVALRH